LRIENPESPIEEIESDLPAILFARQRDLRELLDLSRRQLQLIDEDDYTQLLAVQGAKQKILTRLNAWNSTTPTLKDRWFIERDTLPAPIRKECDRVLTESENALTELFAEERVSTELLQRRCEETRQQLDTLSNGSQAHQAYRQMSAPREPKNLDLNT
jgi:hypothetical protein